MLPFLPLPWTPEGFVPGRGQVTALGECPAGPGSPGLLPHCPRSWASWELAFWPGSRPGLGVLALGLIGLLPGAAGCQAASSSQPAVSCCQGWAPASGPAPGAVFLVTWHSPGGVLQGRRLLFHAQR